MSFSSEVKEELSHVDGHENHCMIAELAAIIGLCGKIKCEDGRYSLILHTENVSVARRFYSLIKDVFHFQPQVSTTQHEFLKKNRFYMISIEAVSYTHLRAHETGRNLVCRLLLEKKKKKKKQEDITN